MLCKGKNTNVQIHRKKFGLNTRQFRRLHNEPSF